MPKKTRRCIICGEIIQRARARYYCFEHRSTALYYRGEGKTPWAHLHGGKFFEAWDKEFGII